MKHRNDIDGIRAIAVLAVVIYHLGYVHKFGGGFVGVDVFFVISGYLITGIIESELVHGGFSFLEFYHRRVRRIFPALFVVYLACILAGCFMLFPSQAKDLGRQITSSLLFVSNIYFYQSSGYFTQKSESSPILHTWSLSVEEQFYIMLPVLLFGLRQVRRPLKLAALGGLAGLSFAASLYEVPRDASAAFYLVPFRAWELLLGSLLAMGVLPPLRSKLSAELAALLGLAAIGLSIYLIGSATPFPGLSAAPACLGTVLLLHAGEGALPVVSRLLGWAPIRFVGQISYSLYLWHWPVITFYRHYRALETHPQRFALFFISFALALLSWRFIENPARRKPFRWNGRRTVAVSAMVGAGVFAIAFLVPRVALQLQPSPAGLDQVLSYLDYEHEAGKIMRQGTCFLTSRSNDASLFRADLCLKKQESKRNFLLVGDSHAAQYWAALQTMSSDIHVLQATASGCKPVIPLRGAERCTSLVKRVYGDFLPHNHVDTIVLSGRWSADDIDSLRSTVRYLEAFSTRVVVLGPVVEYHQPLPRLLAQSLYARRPGLPDNYRKSDARDVDRLFTKELASSNVEYLSSYRALCPEDRCQYWASPLIPVQFDYGHLTLEGAKMVLQSFGSRLVN